MATSACDGGADRYVARAAEREAARVSFVRFMMWELGGALREMLAVLVYVAILLIMARGSR